MLLGMCPSRNLGTWGSLNKKMMAFLEYKRLKGLVAGGQGVQDLNFGPVAFGFPSPIS